MIADLIPGWVWGVLLLAFAAVFLGSTLRSIATRRKLESQVSRQGLQFALLSDLLRQYRDELLKEPPSETRAVRVAHLLRKIFRVAQVTEDR